MFWTEAPNLLRNLHWPGGLDAYRELDRIQSEVNRLLAPLSRVFAEPRFPAVRVLTNEDGALLVAPLPGVDPSEIEVTVSGDSVTLKGGRDTAQPGEQRTWHRNERPSGRFARTITLPFDLDAEKVEASFLNGILEVRLPRVDSQKPRKIKITTS
jgi:HSP20 family protein